MLAHRHEHRHEHRHQHRSGIHGSKKIGPYGGLSIAPAYTDEYYTHFGTTGMWVEEGSGFGGQAVGTFTTYSDANATTGLGGPTRTDSAGGGATRRAGSGNTRSGGPVETQDATAATENAGGGRDGETVPHENMPPYLAINWIIKA